VLSFRSLIVVSMTEFVVLSFPFLIVASGLITHFSSNVKLLDVLEEHAFILLSFLCWLCVLEFLNCCCECILLLYLGFGFGAVTTWHSNAPEPSDHKLIDEILVVAFFVFNPRRPITIQI
jgi:hypothetical protein